MTVRAAEALSAVVPSPHAAESHAEAPAAAPLVVAQAEPPPASRRAPRSAPSSPRPAARVPAFGVGARGAQVGELQTLLRDIGFYDGQISRAFDRATEAAVRRFQAEFVGPDGAQLRVDGLVGPDTMAALRGHAEGRRAEPQEESALASPESVKPWLDPKITLTPGARGRSVEAAQEMLRQLGYDVPRTGVYDEATQRAVSDFQTRSPQRGGRALGVTGNLGRATATAMQAALEATDSTERRWLEATERPAASPSRALRRGPVAASVDPLADGPALRVGDKDRAGQPQRVRLLQERLIELGYTLTADGSFGENTKVALTDFQRVYSLFTGEDLVADGISGPRTAAALQRAIAEGLFDRMPESLRRGELTDAYRRGVRERIVVRRVSGDHKLESRAALAYHAMVSAARDDGESPSLVSAFRSMEKQRELYNYYVIQLGQAGRAARPGYSTHQNGTGIDIHNVDGWMRTNSNGNRFGFTYPNYTYSSGGQVLSERWHWEYTAARQTEAVRQFWRGVGNS